MSKVILLSPSLDQKSGWARYAHDVAHSVAEFADVLVLCNRITEDVHGVEQIQLLRKPLQYFDNPLLILRDLPKVRTAIRSNSHAADDVFIHATAEGYAMFLPWLRVRGAGTCMTIHGTYSVLPLLSRRTRAIYKRTYRRVDRIVACSTYTKNHLVNHAPWLDPGRVTVITNGIRYSPKPPSQSPPNQIRVILCVGAVKNRKGAHNLIRVANSLKRLAPAQAFRIIFVGSVDRSSEYFVSLWRYVQTNGLEKHISFVGEVPEKKLDTYYNTADVFSLLSTNEAFHFEGFPLVFHEAAMHGLPAIGSIGCGAEEAILHGTTGFVVDPSDHEEIAKTLIKMWNGEHIIDSDTCKKWAADNDWSKKPLKSLYSRPST